MSTQASGFNLDVPYIHQIFNTPDNFNGQMAAGPTCMVMVLAAYKKLGRRANIYHSEPSPYGFYVSNTYTGPTGVTFTRSQPIAQSQLHFAGAYGACMNQGQANARLMAEYATNHGLGAQQQPAVWLAVEAELQYGAPVVLATTIKGFGHIVVVKGYTADGRLIVNDPYWGQPGAGELIYSWADFGLTPFMVTFDEPLPKPDFISGGNGFSKELDEPVSPENPLNLPPLN